LPLMLARRKQLSTPQQIQVGLRMIAADFFADFFDADHNDSGFVPGTSCLVLIQLVGVLPGRVQSTKYEELSTPQIITK
jgi:hypothetical protein